MNTIQTLNRQSGRMSNLLAATLCGVALAWFAPGASAVIFTTGNYHSSADLGWDVGSTPKDNYVLASNIGTNGGTMVVGALTFNNVGNAGQGSYNFFNANFGSTAMNNVINPLGLALQNAPLSQNFTGTLSGLVIGDHYHFRLISYDGDNSVNNPNARGDWTFTLGAESATLNAWSALGLPNGSWANNVGSYLQADFVAGATTLNWSLGANTNGKYALLSALTLEDVVPEPTTVMLFGVGGLVVWRKLRRARQA